MRPLIDGAISGGDGAAARLVLLGHQLPALSGAEFTVHCTPVHCNVSQSTGVLLYTSTMHWCTALDQYCANDGDLFFHPT